LFVSDYSFLHSDHVYYCKLTRTFQRIKNCTEKVLSNQDVGSTLPLKGHACCHKPENYYLVNHHRGSFKPNSSSHFLRAKTRLIQDHKAWDL